MMISQWLRRLTESQSPAVDAYGVGTDPRQSSRRRTAAGLESLEGRLVFAVYTVNGVSDGTLASLKGNGTLDLCEAVQLATHLNTTVDGYTSDSSINTIRFDPSLAGQTINLSVIGDSSLGQSAFGMDGVTLLTIDGQAGFNGAGVTIARPPTASPFRFFYNAGGSLTLKGLTVSGFLAKGYGGGGGDVQATGGGSAGMGGAIYNNQGNLTVVNSTLTGNTAQGGDGGSIRYLYATLANGQKVRTTSHSGSGGAGLNGGGADSQFDVAAAGEGGGPNGGVGGVTLYPDGRSGGTGGGGGGAYGSGVSYFYGNAGSGGYGGGGGGGSEGETIKDNIGTNGGNGGFGGGGGGGGHVGESHGGLAGVGGLGGGNGVGSFGGGGGGLGGAIFTSGGTATITNSTLTGNAARGGLGGKNAAGVQGGQSGEGDGGAIISLNGSLTVNDSTISDNASSNNARGVVVLGTSGVARAVFNNTIIGQSNGSADDVDLFVAGSGGTAALSGQGNLIGILYTDPTTVTGALTGTKTGDPKLGPLQDNGGPTPTLALLPGSAALDAGSNAAVPAAVTTDQRGLARITNGTVDIGAVEQRQLQAQTIAFAPLAGRTFGDADFAISATSSSGLPVDFTASGNATVYQNAGVWYVHVVGAGAATITANQAGNTDYAAAASVTQTLTIAKASSTTTTVGGGPFVYNGTAQVGGSGTVSGAGGLNTVPTFVTYAANADGTGVPDLTNAGTYYAIAYYAGDANHTASTGAAVAVVINKATANVNVVGYSGTYDGLAHGATGTATGVNGASVGTLNLGATFVNVPGGTARWTFDGGRNYLSQQGQVDIQIVAKHLTGAFTVANKVYDNTRTATVASRSLAGVVGTDAVSLTGGTATFASKNAGTQTVTLVGATLTGAAAGNYVLDSVATSTATITPKTVSGCAATLPILTTTAKGSLPVLIVPNRNNIVDGQSVAQLFDGASVTLTVGGRTYSVRPRATVIAGVVVANFTITDELRSILAATNGGKAQIVALNFTALSKDGNHALSVTASTLLLNTSK